VSPTSRDGKCAPRSIREEKRSGTLCKPALNFSIGTRQTALGDRYSGGISPPETPRRITWRLPLLLRWVKELFQHPRAGILHLRQLRRFGPASADQINGETHNSGGFPPSIHYLLKKTFTPL